MEKKQIIFAAILVVFFIFVLSTGFVLLFAHQPKTQTTKKNPSPTFIKRDYSYHTKTFPAPYWQVGGLPN